MKLRYVKFFIVLITIHSLTLSNEDRKPNNDSPSTEKKSGCWLPGYPCELPQKMCDRVKELTEAKVTGKPFPANKEKMSFIWGEKGESTDDLLLAAHAVAEAAGVPVIEVDARKDLKKELETQDSNMAPDYYAQAEKLSQETQSPVLVIVKDAHVWYKEKYGLFLGTYQAESDIQRKKETRYITLMVIDHPRNIDRSLWSRLGGYSCQIMAPGFSERRQLLVSQLKSPYSLSAVGVSLIALCSYGSTRKNIVQGVQTAMQLANEKKCSSIGSVDVAYEVLSDNQKNTVYVSGVLAAALAGLCTYKFGKPYIMKLWQQLNALIQHKPVEQVTEVTSNKK